MKRTIHFIMVSLLLLVLANPANSNTLEPEPLFRFDPHWQDQPDQSFIQHKEGFSLEVKIGSANRIFFPTVLDANNPIRIVTRYGTVNQFLGTGETFRAELAGRYLVYRGEGKSLLYRYAGATNELHEFA